MQKVGVVGAGVIGLSASLHLLERFRGAIDVTIVSEHFSPNITSDKAGMLFLPIDFRSEEEKRKSTSNQDEDIRRWTRATFQKYHSIFKSEENAQLEICLEQGYIMMDSPMPDPWYKDEVFGFRHVQLDSVEASLIHVPSTCVDVWSFATYIVDSTVYTNWLMNKVRRGGARFEQKKINSFDELSSYDIIINCTGLGSFDLVSDDQLSPVRGQTVVVNAPWVSQWVVTQGKGRFDYIFPRARNVVLGGTAEAGNWSETPDPKTAKKILRNCQEFVPSLCGAEVVGGWAGLRPLRDPIRLDSCPGPAGNLLIHCYGHGGQGVVLSWGCALDIGDIVQQRLRLNSSL